MTATAPGRGAAATEIEKEEASGNHKPGPVSTQAQPLCPREHHDPLADDKLVLWPSPRRPLHRDLLRLVARWEGEP